MWLHFKPSPPDYVCMKLPRKIKPTEQILYRFKETANNQSSKFSNNPIWNLKNEIQKINNMHKLTN